MNKRYFICFYIIIMTLSILLSSINIYAAEKPTKTLSDGVYVIKSKIDNKFVFDVLGASTGNSTNVQLYEYSNDAQKQFKITYLDDGYYSIIAMHSDKSLDVESAGTKNGTNVQQYSSNGTDAQKWIIKDAGNGYYSIISKCNGLYVDVDSGKAQNYQNIQMYNGNGTDAQKFKFEKKENEDKKEELQPEVKQDEKVKSDTTKTAMPAGEKTLADGIYAIKTKIDSKFGLDVLGASKENSTNIQLYEYSNDAQKQFKVTYLDDGYYSIIAMHSEKSLDVESAGTKNGTNVHQYNLNGTDAQKWIIKDAGNGYYSIVSKCNGLYVDVNSGIAQNYQNIQMYNGNGTDAQKFKFDKIENETKQTNSSTENNNKENNNNQTIIIPSGRKTIEDGIYEIHSSINSDFVLDVLAASRDNFANIQLYKKANVNQQKFTVKYLGDGTYSIIALHSNKAMDVAYGQSTIRTNVQQYEQNTTDAQKWIIDDVGNNQFSIISKCNGLYVDVDGAIANYGTNIQMYTGNGSAAQKFTFVEASNKVVLNDSSKYPGYLEKLQELKNNYPNWNIEFLYTGLTFDEAVSGEYALRKRNLVPKSYGAYSNWVADDDKTLYDTGWYPASRSAIAYQMDPRNFLDSTNIFQFKDVNKFTEYAVSIGKLNERVSGTFLSEYGNDIYYACKNKNVDAYYVVARIIQEGGGATLKMVRSEGTYYNPFNIGASGDRTSNVVNNAYNSAKSRGWNTMQKAIEGGIDFLKNNYLENYQNTLYTNKFDIDQRHGGKLYSHQYMQNLFASQNEASNLKKYYEKEGTMNSEFTFIIPLYENMPKNASPHPTIGSNTICNYTATIKTNDGNGCYIRSGPGTSYSAIGAYIDGTILTVIDNKTYVNTNGYDWYKVVLPNGSQGYMPSKFLK